MIKNYNWRASTRYESTSTLSYGVIPNTEQTWQEAEIGTSGSGTWQYWYRDANRSSGGVWSDADSSRAVLTVTQSWTTSVDQRNNLTVVVNTTIDSLVRDDLRGNNSDTPGRNIIIYEDEGGAPVLSVTDNQVATAHTIYQGPLVLQPETIVLPPGQNAARTTLFLHNNTVGRPTYDHIWVGVEFMNPLPADYRPGATLKTADEYWPTPGGVWVTHNDKNSGCHVLSDVSNMTWKEMRTVGGGVLQTQAPLILNGTDDDSWYDQRELGKYLRT